MKKVLIILFFVLYLGTAGQTQEIRNTSNAVVAKIESDGTVWDKSNFKIARINDKYGHGAHGPRSVALERPRTRR